MNFYARIILLTIIACASGDAPPAYTSSVTYDTQNTGQEVSQSQYVPQYTYSAEPGYSIQSGYEGILVPAPSAAVLPYRVEETDIFGLGLGSSLLKTAKKFPKFGLKVLTKVGGWVLGLAVLFLIGGVFTTAVCTFTPVCTITFLGLNLSRERMRSYMTPDNLTAATNLVLKSIEKYKQLNEDFLSNDIPQHKNVED